MSSWIRCGNCGNLTLECRCDTIDPEYVQQHNRSARPGSLAGVLREKANKFNRSKQQKLERDRAAQLRDMMDAAAERGEFYLKLSSSLTFGTGEILISQDLISWAKLNGIMVIYNGSSEEINNTGFTSYTFSWGGY